MKTAETISSSANQHLHSVSFFQKENQNLFFKSQNEILQEQPFFTGCKESPALLQTKPIFESNEEYVDSDVQMKVSPGGLRIGEPDDVYEKEADATADKVVQRLVQNDTVAEEEDSQIDEGEAPTLEVSESTEPHQTMAESSPVDSLTSGTSDPTAISVQAAPSLTVQEKCDDCEKEEEKREKPEIQKKPLFDIASETTDDQHSPDLQCLPEEMEKTEYPILFKRMPSVQLKSGTSESTMRDRIVKEAQKMVGKIEARKDDGSGRRVGAEHLLEVFHLAANDAWPDEIIENVKYTQASKKFPHWCGIFSVYAVKKAGIDLGFWEIGKGVSAHGTLQSTEDPQPGDIGYFTEHQHHCIIKRVSGDMIDSIDGNSGVYSEVKERTRPRSAFHAFFTPFTGSEKIIQKKSKDSDVSEGESLEGKLQSSAGKGLPLDNETRTQMESTMGADFSGVRIHTGREAEGMNQSLHAQAFTHGNDIYFNEGKYNPGSTDGKHLLAHELTHTVQQGASVKRKKAPEETISQTGSQRVQRWSVWNAAKRVGRGIAGGASAVGRGVVSGARAVGRGVANLAERAMEMGRSALLAAVRRIAPDFALLIERDGIRGFLRNLIKQGFNTLFTAIIDPVKRALNFGGLVQRIRGGLVSIRTLVSGGASNAFHMIKRVAGTVSGFIGNIVSPVFNRIRSAAGSAREFFTSVLEVVGVPIMKVLKRLGGAIWDNLSGFVHRVGRVFNSVKEAIGRAWSRIKRWFGITADQGTQEGGGLWQWIKGKAIALWNTIKPGIDAIAGPIRSIGSILLLLSPAGPAIALFRAWPHLRRAFTWIRMHWNNANVLVRAKNYLSGTLLPMLTSGLQSVGRGMVQASNWLLGILSRVQNTANRFISVLGNNIILSPLKRIVNFAITQFRTITTWIRDGIQYASTHVSQIFRRILDFLMKVWEVVRKIIAIAVNPFGITGLIFGWAWRAMPDSVKGTIIDWIINLLIRVIGAIPTNPMLGLLWPFIKNGVLGFLERMLAFQTARKVRASNKMATIMSGGSPTFAFGFLKGLVLGIWEGITGPFMLIRDLFELPGLVSNFVNALGAQFTEMFNQARELISDIAGNAVGTFQSLLDGLRDLISNPGQIIDIISSAIEAAMSAVRGVGSSIAERLMNLMEEPDDKIGELLGNLTGQFLFEAVLAFFTAGGSAAAGALRQVANVLRRIARNLMPIIRRIIQFLPRVRPFINRLMNLFGRARTGASNILGRIRRFIDRVMEWFQDAFNRMRRTTRRGAPDIDAPDRRGAPRARDRRRDRDGDGDPDSRRRRRDRDDDNDPGWIQIRTAIRNAVRRFEHSGASRTELINAIRSIGTRYRGSRPTVRQEGEAQWQVLAIHPTFGVPREAADVFKDKPTRWRLGSIAVRRRITRLRDNEKSIASINRVLLPIKQEYGYSMLRGEEDRQENDINIMGSMSPSRNIARLKNSTWKTHKFYRPIIQKMDTTDEEIAEVKNDVPDGSYSKPIHMQWYKDPGDYPQRIMLTDAFGHDQFFTFGGGTKPFFIDTEASGIRGRSGRLTTVLENMNESLVSVGEHPQEHQYGHYVELGLEPQYIVRRERKMRRTGSYRQVFTGRYQRAVRALWIAHGYSAVDKDADHVLDLQFGGLDGLENLWPLDSRINQSAWQFGQDKVKVADEEGKEIEKPLNDPSLRNKCFIVKGFKNY